MNKLIRFIPLILVVVLGVVLYRGLSLNPRAMPSALVGKKAPDFNLPLLNDKSKMVTKADLKGKIVLLNVWATWCPTCRYEHPYLLEIIKDKDIALYGVNYKDDRELALEWLNKLGNPYRFTIFDQAGTLGLDLGVYGAPETFVIDPQGVIRKRYAGAVDLNVWRQQFLPLIDKIKKEQQQRN